MFSKEIMYSFQGIFKFRILNCDFNDVTSNVLAF